MATSITDPEFDKQLTLRQSFYVLCEFLKQFNSRSPAETDLLASWLEIEQDGCTSDPAQLKISWRASVLFSAVAPNNSFKPTPLRGAA